MLISKNGKKLMAYVMSLAMLLSCLIFAPKNTMAAQDQPEVTVLGATIRLSQDYDNANGNQSMKFGIKVTNADKAKSCSIKLSLGDKNFTVSTKGKGEAVADGTVDKQITNISSKGADYVEYAVVVRDIPKDYFGSSIGITGYADTLAEESEEVSSSGSDSKSVNGVVEALKAECPKLKIELNESGQLVKDGGSPLTAYDVAHEKGEESSIEETCEFTNTGDETTWKTYTLKNALRIKKTDTVKVVLSSTDQNVGNFSVGLSEKTSGNDINILQEASLKNDGAKIGENTLSVVPNFFTHNYANITKFALSVPAGKTIKLEKIIVIPTDEVAMSVLGLTTIEQGSTSELTAEIDDSDFDSIEWVSSKSNIASVKQDVNDPKKAVVTGEAEGSSDITVKAIKGGKSVKEEVVKFTVTKKVSGMVYNFDISGLPGYDKATGKVTLTANGQVLNFPEGLTMNQGQKVKFTFDYEIPEGGNNIRAYIIAGGNDACLASEQSQDVPTGTKNITCTAASTANQLIIKGVNWQAPNIILSGITMEFVS